MFKKLLEFEWHYHTRNILFYAAFLIYFLLGFFAASMGGFPFPGVYRNSPYVISYIIGLMSLGVIFSMTILIAQTLLRDIDRKMDVIIYATPISKRLYLGTKFIAVFGVGILSFSMLVFGMMIGYHMPWVLREDLGAFDLSHYVWPFMIIAIPNILLCASVLCSLAWITRNKLIIYVGGLFIYIFYIVASIFSNSPLVAGGSPSSAESMAFVAKMDPFCLASFFEQTRYWTVLERNTHGVELTGNFLFNRILWIVLSLMILGISYRLFSFRKMNIKYHKKRKWEEQYSKGIKPYTIVRPVIQTSKHNRLVLISFIKIDLKSVVKGIPFLLIIIMLSAMLIIEISDVIDGGTRMAENITTTGLMITTIMKVIPFCIILVLIFYSSELLWRSTGVNFQMLENATPSNQYSIYFSKLITLSIIPLLLITSSILIGTLFQIINNNAPIDIGLYFSMYYYIGLPMLLIAVLLLSIQVFIPNKYLGLSIAAFVVFIVSTSFGKLIHANHILVRYGNVMKTSYYDMNGFGNYTTSFHSYMLYNSGLAIILIVLSGIVWKNRGYSIKKGYKRTKNNVLQKGIFLLGVVFFWGFGSFILYKTDIEKLSPVSSDNDWKQRYELTFKKYENLPQPLITKVKTNVDLFPEEQRYSVKGSYELVNTTSVKIDSLLLYIDENAKLTSVIIPNAKKIKDLSEYGHQWYRLEQPLQPNDSLKMEFTFESSWSSYQGHTSFNSIIDNGSFMRMSRYFPVLGYQIGNEIEDKNERIKRNLGAVRSLKKLEDKEKVPYDFIDLDAIISTSEDQIAIGLGDLIKEWKVENRNYFHYKTAHPIPFRFAFSSAKYQVKKEQYKGTTIEVYFDAQHQRNVDNLITAAKQALDYCESNFGKYPEKVIRYAEISAFVEGFAATAYPTTLYMKENFGFFSNYNNKTKADVLNQLTGHEFSHQWWGNAQLSPEEKEGGIILTEMLAQYTELMLYEKTHGKEAALESLKVHLDLYLSSRGYTDEMPVYKTHYDTPYLAYDKGMVMMHQLRLLIGEDKVNKALKLLLDNHAYPKPRADSQDLLNEIYKISPIDLHPKINEMFQQIITYTSKIESVSSRKVSDKEYEVSFLVNSKKYSENNVGKRTLIMNDQTIDIGVYDEKGKMVTYIFNLKNNQVIGKIRMTSKPIRLCIDPNLKNIDTFYNDNEKDIL